MAISERPSAKQDTVMDVTEEQIARVYAQAFLAVADKSGREAELVAEVESFVDDVLNCFPQLEQTLRSEFIDAEEKQNVLDRIFRGRASAEMLQFLKVLAVRGRLGILRAIARVLHRLHSERSGRRDVEVRVPRELDASLQDEIRDRLRKVLAAEPVLNVVVDPSLLAGLKLRVGDKVFDASAAVAKGVPAKVGAAIEKRFGFEAPIVTRTAAELRAAFENNPLLKPPIDPKFIYLSRIKYLVGRIEGHWAWSRSNGPPRNVAIRWPNARSSACTKPR